MEAKDFWSQKYGKEIEDPEINSGGQKIWNYFILRND